MLTEIAIYVLLAIVVVVVLYLVKKYLHDLEIERDIIFKKINNIIDSLISPEH